MPRIGLLCQVDGLPVTDQACLACARQLGRRTDPTTGEQRHCEYNYPYIAAITAPDPDRARAGISVTQLANECLRRAVWEKSIPFSLFPRQLQPAQRGTAQHDYLEQFIEPECVAEVRLHKTLPSGRSITGKIDRYRPDLARLEDYKCKGEGKLFEVAPIGYTIQLNIYRYMIQTGCTIMDTGEVLQGAVETLVLYPSDHKLTKEVCCRLWPLEQTERYIERALDYFASDLAQVPRAFVPEQTLYLCYDWCPFFTACRQAGGDPYHPVEEVLAHVPQPLSRSRARRRR